MRRIAAISLLALFFCASLGSAKADYSALLMDASNGRILHEVDADLIRYPASLTKMMTLYMLFGALDEGRISLDDRMTVSSHAAEQPPTKLGLRPGQSIAVNDAILALVTESANDVAAVIAESLAGSEPAFARAMTTKAHKIGMYSTTFINASGLPGPDQGTTARDMSILGLALIHDYPNYYHYFCTQQFYYGRSVHPNHNRLLGVYDGMDGIKTGYTRAAGFNLVASAYRDGQRLIGVVLGARSLANRSAIMTSLLDQGFAGGEIFVARNNVGMSTGTALTRKVASSGAASVSSRRSTKPTVSASVIGASTLKMPTLKAGRSVTASTSRKPPRSATAMRATRPQAKGATVIASRNAAKPALSSTRKTSSVSSTPKASKQVASAAKPKPRNRKVQAMLKAAPPSKPATAARVSARQDRGRRVVDGERHPPS
ncbi:MAG: serine hydrolase [Rhodospirillales bacterium]|nr:serine hydrolase [Rhodospirillales bacterium]